LIRYVIENVTPNEIQAPMHRSAKFQTPPNAVDLL